MDPDEFSLAGGDTGGVIPNIIVTGDALTLRGSSALLSGGKKRRIPYRGGTRQCWEIADIYQPWTRLAIDAKRFDLCPVKGGTGMFTSASKKVSNLDGAAFRLLEGDTRLGKGNG